MSYYMNPLDAEFQGSLVLSDRQFNITFKVKGNSPNSSTLLQSWNFAPYDVSTNKVLTINYSFDSGNTWTPLVISDVGSTALDNTAATAYEVVAVLNANSTFQALFSASVTLDNRGHSYPTIRALRARERFKSYISNGGAEIVLRFNKKAGVAEFPDFFDRHSIANKSKFPDSLGFLVLLDLTTAQDQQIIDEAGFSYIVGLTNGSPIATTLDTSPFVVGDSVEVYDGTTSLSAIISAIATNTSITLDSVWTGSSENGRIAVIHADYQLLRGRSGLFTFQKLTVDSNPGHDRITQIIEYPAGAKVGDFARKIDYVYTGTKLNPDQITEVPYVLTDSDLILPS